MPRASIKFDVSSLRSVLDQLKSIDKKVRTKTLRTALNAGSKIILDSAKSKVPTLYKILKKSLGRKTKVFQAKGFGYAIVGPRRKMGVMIDGVERTPTKYAHLVEYGTAKHPTTKGIVTSAVLLKKIKSIQNFALVGKPHPGARPRPFLRPAWDENKAQVLKVMEDILRDGATGGGS